MAKRGNTEEFIKKAIKKYGEGTYDYSEVKYIDNRTPVKITCLRCGAVLYVEPNRFLRGQSICKCQKQYKKIPQLTKELFILRAEAKYGKGTYGYDQVNYKNIYTKVKIWCPVCQEYFEIMPGTFLTKVSNIGCPRCNQKLMGLNNRTPQDEWIAKAQARWGDVCDYTNTVYTGNKNKVTIYCKEHQGYFEQYPGTHINGAYGCPICSFKHTASESIGEKNVRLVLEDLGIQYDQEHFVIGEIEGRNKDQVRIDFSFEYKGKKFWIEYNGEQHYHFIRFFSHGDDEWLEKQVKRDENISQYAKDHGIELITIPYTYVDYDILHEAILSALNGDNHIKIPKIDYGNRR